MAGEEGQASCVWQVRRGDTCTVGVKKVPTAFVHLCCTAVQRTSGLLFRFRVMHVLL